MKITNINTGDKRYFLKQGAGSDAIHNTAQYAYSVCYLDAEKHVGTGLAFTLGPGNDLVCKAIEQIGKQLVGRDIEELMANFGKEFKTLADDPGYRWLGPHKGVVHLALAAIVNACFDLWAKSRGLPLWKLLIDLSPEALMNTLDLSYLEEVLTYEEALQLLNEARTTSNDRLGILQKGYKGYDTSVGWFNYSKEKIKENILIAMDKGFTAMKLKVGSKDMKRDIERVQLVRETAGNEVTLMVDANQQWNLPKAIEVCNELRQFDPYWVEEPTHPDDVVAHATLARKIQPMKIALGEHVPNRVLFKNYLQMGCMHFNQADAVRVGGISEYITISLLSKKFKVPMVPHVGDMGQIHQHLVLFNHISLGHENLFLEHIPHLQEYFVHPVQIKDGYYQVPEEPGMSADLIR